MSQATRPCGVGVVAFLTLIACLSACGGGAGGSSPVIGVSIAPTPDVTPATTPTATPTPSTTPPLTPTPMPTPTLPSGLVTSASGVTICPASGSSACNNNSATITVTQANYTGPVTESDTCLASVAIVHTLASNGPVAQFKITGQTNTGTCRATFTGGSGKSSGVAIIVVPPGFSIDSISHHKH